MGNNEWPSFVRRVFVVEDDGLSFYATTANKRNARDRLIMGHIRRF